MEWILTLRSGSAYKLSEGNGSCKAKHPREQLAPSPDDRQTIANGHLHSLTKLNVTKTTLLLSCHI